MALRVADNAKTQRYGTVQHDGDAARRTRRSPPTFLPRIGRAVRGEGRRDARRRGGARAPRRLPGATLADATEQDWCTEYLAPIISDQGRRPISTRRSTHINRYGSHHTDAIVTDDHAHAMRFLREVDSASVMVNAVDALRRRLRVRPRRRDRHLTDKLHARGPVGLEGLTSLK